MAEIKSTVERSSLVQGMMQAEKLKRKRVLWLCYEPIKAAREWASSRKALCSRHCFCSMLSISRELHEDKCAQKCCDLHRSDTAAATSGEVPKLLPCQYSMNPTRKALSWLFLVLVLSGGFLQTRARDSPTCSTSLAAGSFPTITSVAWIAPSSFEMKDIAAPLHSLV